MLQIFCDAGFRSGTAVTTCIIFEDWVTYLHMASTVRTDVKSALEAEALAVAQALEWVIENRPDVNAIAVYSDSMSVMQELADYVRYREVWRGLNGNLWVHLCKMVGEFKHVSFYHIKGHQTECNPNVACDRLCSVLLRYRRDGTCTQ